MRKFKFLSFILILCLAASLLAPAALAAEPQIGAPTALLLDRDTGEVLYEKNADERIYPASTTKILTVLMAVEAIEAEKTSLSTMVKASSNMSFDLEDAGSSAGIQVGETMSLQDLLYCAMLASANEACNIIAEHVGGIILWFVEDMNKRAEELGCRSTHFANTHGLPNSNHYTTARDMAKIALEASKHELFMQLCSAPTYTTSATNFAAARTLSNSNALLHSAGMYGSGYVFEGTSGMKTGHTTAAGYCLVSTAERDGKKLLCLVYGADSSDGCFRDSAALLNYGFGGEAVPIFSAPEEPETDPLADVIAGPPLEISRDSFTLPIDSRAAVIVNRETGEAYYTENETARVESADLTKIMTVLLAVEAIEAGRFSITSEVTVNGDALNSLPASATRVLSDGETISMEGLLYCALLPSADDACNVIAEYLEGDISSFVTAMNRRAKELGCVDTRFANPTGLPAEGAHSTPADFALIALEASRHDLFLRIAGTRAVELPDTNKTAAHTIINTNPLINEDSPYGSSYLYERAYGLKTGYSESAGFCVAAAAKDPVTGIDLVGVVFRGVRSDSGISCYSDIRALFDYVFDHYSYHEILKSSENIASVDIALGSDADYVNLRPASSITALLPNDYDRDSFDMQLTVYSLQEGKTLTAPISAGEVLGEVTVLRDGVSYGTVKLLASSNVDLSRLQYLKSQVEQTIHSKTFRLIFWGLIAFFALYVIWVIVYRVRHIRHRMAVRARAREEREAREAAETPPAGEPELSFFPAEETHEAQESADSFEDDSQTLPNITLFPNAEEAEPEAPAAEERPTMLIPPLHEPEEAEDMPAALLQMKEPELPSAEREPVPFDEPEKPAQPEPPKKKAPKDPYAALDMELEMLRNQEDRDYFEEFFRRK